MEEKEFYKLDTKDPYYIEGNYEGKTTLGLVLFIVGAVWIALMAAVVAYIFKSGGDQAGKTAGAVFCGAVGAGVGWLCPYGLVVLLRAPARKRNLRKFAEEGTVTHGQITWYQCREEWRENGDGGIDTYYRAKISYCFKDKQGAERNGKLDTVYNTPMPPIRFVTGENVAVLFDEKKPSKSAILSQYTLEGESPVHKLPAEIVAGLTGERLKADAFRPRKKSKREIDAPRTALVTGIAMTAFGLGGFLGFLFGVYLRAAAGAEADIRAVVLILLALFLIVLLGIGVFGAAITVWAILTRKKQAAIVRGGYLTKGYLLSPEAYSRTKRLEYIYKNWRGEFVRGQMLKYAYSSYSDDNEFVRQLMENSGAKKKYDAVVVAYDDAGDSFVVGPAP